MNNNSNIAVLRLTKELANTWNEYHEPGCVLYDTKRLFINASRPYYEYYLPEIDRLVIDEPALLGCRDDVMRAFAEDKRTNGSVMEIDDYKELVANKCKTAKNILVLTTKKRFKSVLAHCSRLDNSSVMDYLKLDELVAEREMEPGWYWVREYFRKHQPDLVLVALGWERVVYLARFKKLFQLTALDLGDFALEQPIKFRARERAKKILKPILRYVGAIK